VNHLDATKLLIGLYAWCLYDQCIDIECVSRIREAERGLSGLARSLTGPLPAKVPYFLGFYPPTLRWSVDYTNINFLWDTPISIVNLTHRDPPGSDRRDQRDRPGTPSLLVPCGHYSSNLRVLAPNGDSNSLFPLAISRRLHPNSPLITLLIPPPALLARGTATLPIGDFLKFFPEIAQFPQEHLNG
jgi:hypothetical protein